MNRPEAAIKSWCEFIGIPAPSVFWGDCPVHGFGHDSHYCNDRICLPEEYLDKHTREPLDDCEQVVEALTYHEFYHYCFDLVRRGVIGTYEIEENFCELMGDERTFRGIYTPMLPAS